MWVVVLIVLAIAAKPLYKKIKRAAELEKLRVLSEECERKFKADVERMKNTEFFKKLSADIMRVNKERIAYVISRSNELSNLVPTLRVRNDSVKMSSLERKFIFNDMGYKNLKNNEVSILLEAIDETCGYKHECTYSDYVSLVPDYTFWQPIIDDMVAKTPRREYKSIL